MPTTFNHSPGQPDRRARSDAPDAVPEGPAMTAHALIANERASLVGSLWAATANATPECLPLTGDVECDTVVIGGGFTGLSAALHLAESGQSVRLLEAETPGWGASGRNGGQVNPGLKHDPEALIARYGADMGNRMARRAGGSADLVFDLIARHGIDCAANRSGWLRAAHTEKARRALEDTARQWRDAGAAVDAVSQAEMARLIGADAYSGGIIDRRGGNLHPLNYALGLADAAIRTGAVLHSHSRVTAIDEDEDSVTARTDHGTVRAARAVIGTNAYTGPLAAPLGQAVVPVTSVQVATAPLGANIAGSILPEGHSPSDTRRLLVYFRKDPHGRFVIGARGAVGDKAIRARQAALRDAAIQLYPQLRGADWSHAWGGDVAITPDHMPRLFKLSPRTAAGIGFNGRGVGMATVMGTILADWARGVPEDALDFPVTQPRPIPFHRFRRLGVGVTVAAFRALDRFGL